MGEGDERQARFAQEKVVTGDPAFDEKMRALQFLIKREIERALPSMLGASKP